MLANLRDIVYTRWFNCAHASWMLSNIPITEEERLIKGSRVADWRVELSLDMFTRIADIENFDVVLAALSPEERARVTPTRHSELPEPTPVRLELLLGLAATRRSYCYENDYSHVGH